MKQGQIAGISVFHFSPGGQAGEDIFRVKEETDEINIMECKWNPGVCPEGIP